MVRKKGWKRVINKGGGYYTSHSHYTILKKIQLHKVLLLQVNKVANYFLLLYLVNF